MIDFEVKLQEYLREKFADYQYQDGVTGEQLEDMLNEAAEEWLKMPQTWLDGKTPLTYFDDFEGGALLSEFCKYLLEGYEPPAGIYASMDKRAGEIMPLLLYTIEQFIGDAGEKSEHLVMHLLEYLCETDDPPYGRMLEWLVHAPEGEFAEALVEALKQSDLKDEVLTEYRRCEDEYKRLCYLDILSDIGDDKELVEAVGNKLLTSDKDKAFLAHCLSRMGDEDALPFLNEALKSTQDYYDYTAIADAIEALGGETPPPREFAGDADYEKMIEVNEHDDA